MYDFKHVEQEARKIWQKNKAKIEKATKEKRPGKKGFSFLEGPPTANAPPGLHHLEVRTYKDVINKFRYMQGFSVPRKGGWDCHGLPVEVQVEKQLGLKSKKEVISYGTDKFIQKARDSVFSNIKDWEKSTEELGYWIDLDNPYRTLDNNYIESVWWSLKELYKKGFLYEGYKVVPFCTRCGTPLSSHEVALGYKDVKEESVYVKFKLKNGGYILAWTTTPWTLPGNVALAVGKDIKYVKIELENKERLILAKDRISVIQGKFKILKEFHGKELLGLEYEPLFDIPKVRNEKSHKVVLADFVTTEDGTGVVHTAVMYGEDDYNIGMKLGLPAIHTVSQEGKFLDIVPKFHGRYVKEAERDIIEDLKHRDLVHKTEKVMHSYPFCWRCETPLLYYGINSWFIRVSSIRDKMMAANSKINWEPKHIKEGRFGKWLEGAKDWALSRFKFWGTPLPVWRCSNCKEIKVIGSVAELKKESTKKISDKIDLHKPYVDHVKLKCSCGSEMSRIPDVIDCWYDSGSASFAQFHYPFENKKEFESRFPYDFIAEAIDQTRGWFYTLHVLSVLLFGKPAYKNVICAGHIVDEKGEKMSKSKGNIIQPREIIDKAGVDAIRLQFCTSDAGNQKRFSFDLMRESVLPFLTVLHNLDNYHRNLEKKKTNLRIEDKWILSKLNSTIRDVTADLNGFLISPAFLKIQDFTVNSLSRKYVKMTRDRDDTKEIIGECLKKVSLMLAPFAPYITEKIYSGFSKDSVHLSSWPKIEAKKINLVLEKKMENALGIIESGLSARDKAAIGLRWPLSDITVYTKDKKSFSDLESVIKSQLNIKKIIWRTPDSKAVEFDIELNTEQTKELEAEGYAREISRAVQDFRKQLGMQKKDIIELKIVTDDEFIRILEMNKKMIKERTNSKNVDFITTVRERFKNKIPFKIKDKRGEIAIIVTKG